MKMKNQNRWLCCLVVSVFGCSDYGFDDPGPFPVVEEPAFPGLPSGVEPEPSDAELVSELEVEGVRVQFFAVPTTFDEVGVLSDGTVIRQPVESIMTMEHGSQGSGDPVTEVHLSHEGGLTSAELWIGLTGTPELVPSRLAALHEYEAWMLGRDSVAIADVSRVPFTPYALKAGGWDDQNTFLQPIVGFQQFDRFFNTVSFGTGVGRRIVWACTGRLSSESHTGAINQLGDTCQRTLRTGWVQIGIANTRPAVGPEPGFHGPSDFHVEPFYALDDGVWRAMSKMDLAPLSWTLWGWNVPQNHGLSLAPQHWDADSEHAVRFFTARVRAL